MALENTKIGKIGPKFSFGCETRIEQVRISDFVVHVIKAKFTMSKI
jgi:hypothetical protein